MRLWRIRRDGGPGKDLRSKAFCMYYITKVKTLKELFRKTIEKKQIFLYNVKKERLHADLSSALCKKGENAPAPAGAVLSDMLKFLHCADLHLDSPFRTGNPGTSAVRRNELRGVFSSMMLYARTNGIRLMLMAGDLFDTEFVTKETVELLLHEFSSFPSCKFVISPGNHDPYTPNSVYARIRFPSNVYIFGSEEPSVFRFDDLGADVYGYAFTSPSLASFPLAARRPDRPDRINLVCAHGDILSPESRSCPIPPGWFRSCGFDYAALGHVHNSDGIQRSGDTYYGYSGCLEGRDFGETGYKGAIEVEASKTDGTFFARCRGIRFSRRRYETASLDLTGVTDRYDAENRVRALLGEKKFGSDTSLRLTLTGSVPADFPAPGEWLAACGEGLYALTLADQTLPLLNREALEEDQTIIGAFYRRLLPKLENGTPEEKRLAAEALRAGLTALRGGDLETDR